MLTLQTLIDDLKQGCKPKDNWRIGVELERFAFTPSDNMPLRYDAAAGTRALLEKMAQDYGYKIITEAGLPIALEKDGMNLSLEPGGQIEYAGPPVKTLAEIKSDFETFDDHLTRAAEALGISFLFAGFHPTWSRDDIAWMPKGRYRIMREYMNKKGDHGVDMMIRTCGTQVNLDYGDERDMIRKYRVTLALQPVITALMANSHMKEGKDTGLVSYRANVWTDTDPDRCGVPEFVFDEDMGFARYVEYALNVPMYFVYRDGTYHDVSGLSFRDFMDGTLKGFEGEYPTIEDWRNHLTTLFPEVRLKHYLELRGLDSNTPDMMMAMTAFWAGLLYNEEALTKAEALIANWRARDVTEFTAATVKSGLTALTPSGQELKCLAKELLEITETALAEEDKTFLKPFWQKITCCPDLKAAC